MIVFIIPLKSRKVSAHWEKVSQLFERCLKSVCHQTDSDFHVIVVCHEKPEISFQHSNVSYVEADFPPPGSDIRDRRIDKGKKTIIGLRKALEFQPNHAMIVDADDCLSCRVAEFVNKHPNANGWFINQGYVYQEKSPFIYFRKAHFHHWCGTCNIAKFSLWPLPESDNHYPTQLIDYYSGCNHKHIEKELKKKGTPLQPLPLTGVTYIIGNGENIYQKGFSTIHRSNQDKPFFMLKELVKFRLLTSAIRREFGITPISS